MKFFYTQPADGFCTASFHCHFDRPLPPAPEAGSGGCLVVGGPIRPARSGELADHCVRYDYSLVCAGFSPTPAADTAAFCRRLQDRGLTPILTHACWQPELGAAVLLSTAISGGRLRELLLKALEQYGQVYLDGERLCRRFPLPCADGQGAPLSPAEWEVLHGQGEPPFFSQSLQCMAQLVRESGTGSFLLWDERETLCRKAALAASLGVSGMFLLDSEWSREDVLAACAGAAENPAIRR